LKWCMDGQDKNDSKYKSSVRYQFVGNNIC
jgi:hypothetical protein